MKNQTLIVAAVVILFLYFFVFKKKESFTTDDATLGMNLIKNSFAMLYSKSTEHFTVNIPNVNINDELPNPDLASNPDDRDILVILRKLNVRPKELYDTMLKLDTEPSALNLVDRNLRVKYLQILNYLLANVYPYLSPLISQKLTRGAPIEVQQNIQGLQRLTVRIVTLLINETLAVPGTSNYSIDITTGQLLCEPGKMIYLTNNPDVKAAGIDAWAHYKNNGQKEGRKWNGIDCDSTTLKLETGIPNQQPVGWTVTCNKNDPIPGGVYKYLGGNIISHLPTDEIARSVDANYSSAAGRAIDCTGYVLAPPQTLPHTSKGGEGSLFDPKCYPASAEFTYGAPGKQIKVQKQITSITPFIINNDTMGGDPAPGLPKTWDVIYRCA